MPTSLHHEKQEKTKLKDRKRKVFYPFYAIRKPLDEFIAEPEVLMIRRSESAVRRFCAAAMRIHWKLSREPSEEEIWREEGSLFF